MTDYAVCSLSSSIVRMNSESVPQSYFNKINVFIVDNKHIQAFKHTMQSDVLRPPLRAELGYIRGVVTRKGQIAAGQHVVCLNSRFNIVAETVSSSDGSYRFDSLSIYGTYIIIAQDNWDFKYAPVGADRRTPEAYS